VKTISEFFPCIPELAITAALSALAVSITPAGAQTSPDYTGNIAHQVARVQTEVADANKSVRFHASWNSLAAYTTPEWFQDAKFGIFLHWGVYSVPAFGNEWYSRNMYIPSNAAYKHHVTTYGSPETFGYKDFVPLFQAKHFDPASWTDLFVQAGARYVVPVAEHCDGFAMYSSKMTPWNAAQMGPHRDVVGEIAQAVRARGLRFGVSSHTAEHWWWYGVGMAIPSDVHNVTAPSWLMYGPAAPMSLPIAAKDGHSETEDALTREPDPNHLEEWAPPDKPFLDGWLARSTELVDKYHPDFFYFDWWIGQPAFKPYLQQFAAYYYDRSHEQNIQPVLTYKEEAMPPNTATLDIERGKLDTLRLLPWQTDTSISIHSWGYVEHDEYRSAHSLIQQLVDTVSKNGNLLLNVGPKSDGTIPDEARSVLLEIGAWLKVNGEAIYGSRPFAVFGEGPTKAPAKSQEKNHDIQSFTAGDIRYTVSGPSSHRTALYATAMEWPTSGALTLHTLFHKNPYLPAPVCAVTLLGATGIIAFHQDAYGLQISLPKTPPQPLPPGSVYVFRIQTKCA
jgi:alpha-L-fucosidase